MRRAALALLGVLLSLGVLPGESLAQGSSEAPEGRVDSSSPEPARPEAPDSLATPITLETALEMAHTGSPDAIAARGQLETSAAAVRSGYAAFIPSLSVSARSSRRFPAGAGTRREGDQLITVPSDPWSSSVGMSASLDLFNGGRRIFELQQAKAGVKEAEAGEELTRYQVDLAVKQQFFAVLAAREASMAAQAQLDQAREQSHAVSLRVRGGSATVSDSLRAEIQLRNAKLAVSSARNDIQVAAASLTRTVAAPYPVTAADEALEAPAPAPLDEAEVARLAEAGPAVVEAEARLASAHAARSASWSGYLPSLSASYSQGGAGSGRALGGGLNELEHSGSYGVSLSFPLFNQLAREEGVIRARVAETNAEANYNDARLAAREAAVRSLGTLRIAAERLEAQEATVASAEEDLRVQEQRYSLGASTLLDVLTSQTQLNSAREALIRARYDQRIARAELEALLGRAL